VAARGSFSGTGSFPFAPKQSAAHESNWQKKEHGVSDRPWVDSRTWDLGYEEVGRLGGFHQPVRGVARIYAGLATDSSVARKGSFGLQAAATVWSVRGHLGTRPHDAGGRLGGRPGSSEGPGQSKSKSVGNPG